MSARHRANAQLFATAGGFAPTLGILGTVLRLVHVLENLSNPGALGHSIAGAFLATLYGVGSANLIFLPVAQQAQGALRRARSTTARCCSRRSSRSRPATTRACCAEKLETFVSPERARPPTAADAPKPRPSRRRRGRRRSRRERPRQPSAAAAHRRGGHEGGDERWLLTYADMITLLMALFIVLWAISSVNISKFDELKAVAPPGLLRQDLAGDAARS